jgi:uncharacterized membrane protein YadS
MARPPQFIYQFPLTDFAMPAAKPKLNLTEDWTTVLLGLGLVGLAVGGAALPVPSFGWRDAGQLAGKVLAGPNLAALGLQLGLAGAVVGLAAWLAGKSPKRHLLGFGLLAAPTLLALLLAGNASAKALNLEAVLFSLALGLAIGNLVRLPEWLRGALSTELMVKLGLVLLGTTVIFSDLLQAGALGLVQALVVVVVVWYFAYWLCRWLRVDAELTMMIASAVSICGVSAAIATAGAIKGDPKKLSYTVSLVLVTAVPMMLLMPLAADYLGLPQAVTGAWLGGSIDTTGAVVASGTLVGEEALRVSTIAKFSQNVLLGLAALGISVYWSFYGGEMSVGTRTTADTNNGDELSVGTRTTAVGTRTTAAAAGLGLVWERFPKFVFGFLLASAWFSFGLAPETVAAAKDGLKAMQGLWFALAFTGIGLETRLGDIFNPAGQRPLWAFLGAQAFNILLTLGVAWVLFG